jgi:hypothetical protein
MTHMRDAPAPPPVREDTLPRRALRRLGPAWAAIIVTAFLLLIVLGAGFAGFRAGLSKNASLSATETAAEAARQYQLGLEDVAAGRLMTAADRFRFVLSLDPQHAEAAQRLAELEAALSRATAAPASRPTLPPGARPQSAPADLLAEARAAVNAKDWDRALSLLAELQAAHPNFEPGQVGSTVGHAYRERGLARIAEHRLQEGIFDLNQAETYGALDEEAEAYRVWATLYVRGSGLWGADWPATIAIFEDLYRAAPYFHDTMAKLHGAYVAYGDLLWAQGDPCAAAGQYASASQVLAEAAVDEQRLAAEAACAALTQTPEASETPGA